MTIARISICRCRSTLGLEVPPFSSKDCRAHALRGRDGSGHDRSGYARRRPTDCRPSAARCLALGGPDAADGFDVLACPRCRGQLRLIALIEQVNVIRRILRHLGVPTEILEEPRLAGEPDIAGRPALRRDPRHA